MPKYHITELTEIRDGPLERFFFGWGGGGGKGGGRGTKKNSCMQIRPGKKIPALAFHTFYTNLNKAGRKAHCVQNSNFLNKLPAEVWSCKYHT